MDLENLTERLRRTKTEHRMHMMFGGISVHDEGETREVPVNPDGPEAADALSALQLQLTEAREQGQREGKAAVCQWLRDRSANKPTLPIAGVAAMLADHFEQSEIPCQASALQESQTS